MAVQSGSDLQGYIFNVQRFSTHDGPGIRTTVFLKGCPLRCFWCQNPESQCIDPVLLFNNDLCCGCGACIPHCPQNAIRLENGKGALDRDLCRSCGACTEFCGHHARTVAGSAVTVSELMEKVLKDRFIFEDSGGGVTISGGEPTVQWQFAQAVLRACRAKYISTAIETCGYAAWDTLKSLVQLCDLVFFDLKCIDPGLHRAGTGVSNGLILSNAKKLVEMGVNVRFRTPLIPGFNDGEEHIAALRDFVVKTLGLPADRVELLKYNKLGEDKFLRMGELDRRPDLTPQSDEYIEFLNSVLMK
ncbi:MAG: glycyl-radical enzyme activating protein [Oscillospiraceae bacterium]